MRAQGLVEPLDVGGVGLDRARPLPHPFDPGALLGDLLAQHDRAGGDVPLAGGAREGCRRSTSRR